MLWITKIITSQINFNKKNSTSTHFSNIYFYNTHFYKITQMKL